MIYNITTHDSIICSTDGSIKNMVKPFNKWEIINNTFILPEAGELFFKDKTYEITEPSVAFVTYRINDNDDKEIIIIPCKDAVNKLLELTDLRKKFMEMDKASDCCTPSES